MRLAAAGLLLLLSGGAAFATHAGGPDDLSGTCTHRARPPIVVRRGFGRVSVQPLPEAYGACEVTETGCRFEVTGLCDEPFGPRRWSS